MLVKRLVQPAERRIGGDQHGQRGTSASGTPVKGGTMQVAFQSDPDTFDPQVCYDATCWDNMQMLFDRLYDYKGATTDLESEAAASMPVVSGGGKVYTIAIRKGMTFDNGKPVTAADFVYTFSRICNPATKSPVVSFWDVVSGCAAFAKNPVGSVSGIKALSTYSLQITLTQPDAAFTYVLAMPHASVIPAGSGAQQALHPLGSGPFEMVSYTPGQSIILKANPNYWDKSLPYVTGVNEKLGVSPEVQLLELEKGQIDLMGDPLPNSDYLTVVGNKSLASQIHQRQSLDTYYLTLNTKVKPFNNPLVREAVSYAINRSFLLKLVNGQGSPATGFIPPGVTGTPARTWSTRSTSPRPSSCWPRPATRTASAPPSTAGTPSRGPTLTPPSSSSWPRSASPSTCGRSRRARSSPWPPPRARRR